MNEQFIMTKIANFSICPKIIRILYLKNESVLCRGEIDQPNWPVDYQYCYYICTTKLIDSSHS